MDLIIYYNNEKERFPMKTLKKSLAVLLAALMLASLFSVAAYAVEQTDAADAVEAGYARIDINSNIAPSSSKTYKVAIQDSVKIDFVLKTDVSVEDSQGVLTYDHNALQLVSFELPNLANPVVNTELVDKVIFNSSSANGSAAFKTGAALASAEFKLLAEGATKVELNLEELNGSKDGAETAIVTNGAVVDSASTFDTATSEAATDPTQAPTTPAKVALNKTSLSLKSGKTAALKVTGTTAKAAFKSSKKSIATVSSNGKVTALKKGSATITATVAGKTLKCTVKVTSSPKIKVAGKKFSAKKTYAVKKGKTLKIKVTGKAKAVKNKLTYSKKGVIKASGTTTVKVKAKKKGSVKLTLKVNNSSTFRIKIKVS